MKQEWKPDELRATAAEIREAVMPKSITPEMVGGTLAGLTEAVAEVVETLGEIPREHVRVEVTACDGQSKVSAEGATVRLDVFAVGGFPCTAMPRQELTADADGVVEFDVPHGFKYAVSSHIDGLGASFQLVFDAVAEQRDVRLWNFPVGVWALGHTDLAHYGDDGWEDEYYTAIPFVTPMRMEEVPEEIYLWAQDSEKYPQNEGWWYIGVLVSTAETTFAIGKNSLSDKTMEWCDSRDRNTLFPLMDYAVQKRSTAHDYDAAIEKARTDMDGNMNTAKILGFSPTHTAARWAASSPSDYDEQRFLPSAGQLYIMWLNRTAINAIIQQHTDAGEEGFFLLPDIKPGTTDQWTQPNGRWEYWWSSSVYDSLCSWVVGYYGYSNDDLSDRTYDVRAVSAFHFEY